MQARYRLNGRVWEGFPRWSFCAPQGEHLLSFFGKDCATAKAKNPQKRVVFMLKLSVLGVAVTPGTWSGTPEGKRSVSGEIYSPLPEVILALFPYLLQVFFSAFSETFLFGLLSDF